MKKKVVVLSLGGSLIIPDEVDMGYLKKLKIILKKYSRTYKFIVVCGGGSVARKYISALKETNATEELQCLAGISATRMNARFMSYFFNDDAEEGIPHEKKQIKKYLEKKDVVFCGALEYKTKQTSDSTSAEIAQYFNSDFVNLTNVPGLYDKDPKKHKDAKFISKISWKEFYKMANKISFKPGQHFILDQSASKIIMDNKIKTIIIGDNLKELDNFFRGKKFKGTIIEG